MRVLSLFSGIGAFEKALTRQNIEYELVNYCEIDKYASKAYSLIHNVSEKLNLGDITKINEKELLDFDLMTWGFPCTDISIAGEQQGFINKDGNKTRSGLYYDGLRILKEKKSKISIIENVKNLTGKKFKKQFEQILKDLENAGYNNYWKILNAKDYGIPQNRERVYIISIRKDIDNGKFEFPKGFDNGVKLKDLLEENVDEKYYINQKYVDELIEKLKNKEISNTIRSGGRGSIDRHSWDLVCVPYKQGILINKGNIKIKKNDVCSCIDANYGKGLDNHAARTGIMQIGMLDIKGNEQVRRVYSPNGISPTLNTMQGGNRQPKILIQYRIRKLTPLECWRLMGFKDKDFYICKNNKISDFQLYKMAGNSIVVDVLEEIFKRIQI